jgi:dTDP-4-amino-4,6-dideoxygalactose transaminase
MPYNPFDIVKQFENAVAEYTGAPYAVAVDSCTNAIFLCCKYLMVDTVVIPAKTYLSVPMAIINAGGKVKFTKAEWDGIYRLHPYNIYDAAKRFTSNMYIPETYMCLSFHVKKRLNLGKGGMILTYDADAVEWFKRARYEGRGELDYRKDDIKMIGWNMYMTPEQAARGLTLLPHIGRNNDDITEEQGYRDLTEFTIFKDASDLQTR